MAMRGGLKESDSCQATQATQSTQVNLAV